MLRPEALTAPEGEGDEIPGANKIKSHVATFVLLVCLFRAAKVAAEHMGLGFEM